jgi:hypothetical protein
MTYTYNDKKYTVHIIYERRLTERLKNEAHMLVLELFMLKIV